MTVKTRHVFLRLGLYSLFLGALMLVLVVDANAVDGKFFEGSLTERTQEVMFLLLSISMFYCSRRMKPVLNLAAMFSGFFLVCFIRELDALLEQNIGTGTWQLLVTLVLAAMIFKAYKNWPALQGEFATNVSTYNFGLFAAGFLTTFIFSRLVGSEELWMAIMEESYQRNVKNAVEESVELLGDALMFFAGFEFFLRYRGGSSQAGAIDS